MKRHLLRALALLGGWHAATGLAEAQYPAGQASGLTPFPAAGYQPGGVYGTPARPPVSPYLNITQGTGNPAVNYYNFARPALQTQRFYQQQQGAAGLPLTEPFGLASMDVLYAPPNLAPHLRLPSPTGHATGYMYYSGYFNSLGTIGAGGPGAAPQAVAPSAQAGAAPAAAPAAPRR